VTSSYVIQTKMSTAGDVHQCHINIESWYVLKSTTAKTLKKNSWNLHNFKILRVDVFDRSK